VLADRTVHEPQPTDDPDTALSFTMEGARDAPVASLLTHIWQPNWNSVQALTRFQEEINGPLRGGDPGVRLLEPGGEGPPTYFSERPAPPPLRAGELRLVPLHHVFGSEELSARSRYVVTLTPEVYVGLSPEDARALGAEPGSLVAIELDGRTVRVPARIVGGLGAGLAGIPVGLDPFGYGPLPAVARIARA
jgi:NADH-quinone oxidoreductase subunit G